MNIYKEMERNLESCYGFRQKQERKFEERKMKSNFLFQRDLLKEDISQLVKMSLLRKWVPIWSL